ncbi:MAG: CocE/NonD family hydrolase [Rhodobacteraceae bacterium]|nr:CocE/NonD family hydrolase [Paracoccaceae bacterium]
MDAPTQTDAHRTETRDGMTIEWDAPIPARDGLILRADIFRPQGAGTYPVLLSYGPYAKGLAFQDGYPSAWNAMAEKHPDVTAGSSNLYQSWEVADPEKWVPDGYVLVRVDSRGCGRSPGYVSHFSQDETQDLYDCIEWAAVQPWSSGKVGLSGVSYYGINQWQVASLQPPSLAAMCVWEGASDSYRDMTHHGGILSTFWANWYDIQVKSVQHGLGTRGPRSRATGDLVCGPNTLDEAALATNRCDYGPEIRAHPLDDAYHAARTGQFDRITVPLLSAGNWGGQGLHLRGNTEGYYRAASDQKWLELHGLEHWTEYYTDYGVALQKQFFGHFLKGEDTGWTRHRPVILKVRRVDGFEEREEEAWPLPATDWTRLYLDFADHTLSPAPVENAEPLSFEAMGEGVTFFSAPMAQETEFTGPSSAKMTVSSSSTDADLFLILRLYDPEGEEFVFLGAIDPHAPLTMGWLRASHRKLDPALSTLWRPYHSHDEVQPLAPGERVDLDIELWPTSIVVPKGWRIGLTVKGCDYVTSRPTGARLGHFRNEMTGCGPFLHDDPVNRPPEVFGGTTTLHGTASILLPKIPR